MAGVLAIDHGEKKSGFAACDADRLLCVPLAPVRLPGSSEALLEHVDGLLEERSVDTFLVGLPPAPRGGTGERRRSVVAFLRRLRARFPEHRICVLDEHLTTKEAEARLREAGYSRGALKARRDSWSALVLLEEWLASGEPPGPPWEGPASEAMLPDA